ncbi:hypothetical protein KC717_05230 [Candidatus Dojkabacteria bacterium]|uniref:Heat-inducible transcription repressor HrcA n=1 Tax=Candidatus Dojkabacteria bacterium TaxID=2099670 RepID=A0A955RL58_9BACT|nr:hypothetical protein [Candidatus Dojkabacteria bacterium]
MKDDITLSDRQKDLLRAIIQEFMDTAEAVGSIHLPEKYDLGVSPATIRNEMVVLARKGVIRKAHASSGRIPTSEGFKFFIDELLGEMSQLGVESEVRVREVLFQNRFDPDKLLYEAVKNLHNLTGNTGVALFRNRIYYHGLSGMIDMPEYQQPRRLKRLLSVLEDYDELSRVFERGDDVDIDGVSILIGEEDIGIDTFEKVAVAFGQLKLHRGETGFLSVIGPNRMDYAQVIPTLRWMINTINQSVVGWNG